MRDAVEGLAAGAVAGFAATGPMTLFMQAVREPLPNDERYPVPPREVTERAAETVGVDRHDLSETQWRALTGLSHFGFGTAAGSVYGVIAPHLPVGPVTGGVAYGLTIYAASYLGWLPATGLFPHAKDEPPRRNLLNIGSHVVWGAVLGWVTGRLLANDGENRGKRGTPAGDGSTTGRGSERSFESARL